MQTHPPPGAGSLCWNLTCSLFSFSLPLKLANLHLHMIQGKWLSSPCSVYNNQGIWPGPSGKDLEMSTGAEILLSSYWINSTLLDFTFPQTLSSLKVSPLDPHLCDPSVQMTSLKDLKPNKMSLGGILRRSAQDTELLWIKFYFPTDLHKCFRGTLSSVLTGPQEAGSSNTLLL